jgi:hypothetical protein
MHAPTSPETLAARGFCRAAREARLAALDRADAR